jgi:hypothetical protein
MASLASIANEIGSVLVGGDAKDPPAGLIEWMLCRPARQNIHIDGRFSGRAG